MEKNDSNNKNEDGSAKGSGEPERSQEENNFISEYLALTREGMLIKKGAITVRMFLASGGGMILAYAFSELPDSFVIGFPAIISGADTNNITAKMVTPTPMSRMYKHSFAISGIPPEKFLLCYLIATKPLLNTLPGFFDETRKTQVDSLIKVLGESLGLSEVKKANTKKPDSSSLIKSSSAESFEMPEPDFMSTNNIKKPKYQH